MARKYDFDLVYPTVQSGNRQVLDLYLGDFRFFHIFLQGKELITYQIDDSTEHRLDLISYENYNSVSYWWIIGLVNGVIDPFTELPAGREILILPLPMIEQYHQLIRSLKRKQSIASSGG